MFHVWEFQRRPRPWYVVAKAQNIQIQNVYSITDYVKSLTAKYVAMLMMITEIVLL